MALLGVLHALPLTYNKDMQEDKEPLFDTIDTVKGSLKIFADMIREMRVNADTMRERTFMPALHGFIDTLREDRVESPEERQRWAARLKPIEEEWLKSMEAKGLPGRQLLQDLREAIKKYDP